MTREEAIDTIMSATVWTDEEREALGILIPEFKESEDDKIKRTISDILHFDNEEIREVLKSRNLTYTQVWDYLERQKETPIDNVFGFRIGDKVRLADGDGRPHIIKRFEKVNGLHGPDFYRVIFEDNTASDHIIPGEEYRGGYFTCMEKIQEVDEKQIINKHITNDYLSGEINARLNECGWYVSDKSGRFFVKDSIHKIMNKLTELSNSDLIPVNSKEYKKIDEITSDVADLLNYTYQN